jgi:hypothetical protein
VVTTRTVEVLEPFFRYDSGQEIPQPTTHAEREACSHEKPAPPPKFAVTRLSSSFSALGRMVGRPVLKLTCLF